MKKNKYSEKEINILVDRLNKYLGKHSPIAFMHSVGYKCKKEDGEEMYSVTLHSVVDPAWLKISKVLEEPIFKGIYKRSNIVRVAIEDGYDPIKLLKDKSVPLGYFEPQPMVDISTKAFRTFSVNKVTKIN